jgi:hypothetical protein
VIELHLCEKYIFFCLLFYVFSHWLALTRWLTAADDDDDAQQRDEKPSKKYMCTVNNIYV